MNAPPAAKGKRAMLAFGNRIAGLVNRRLSISASNGARRVFLRFAPFRRFFTVSWRKPRRTRRAPLDAQIDHRRFTGPPVRFLKSEIALYQISADGALIRDHPDAHEERKRK